jgi:AGCS family alanine or glycine:cation symporter
MVVIGIMLFAYSTILSWSYYGEKGIEYLAGTAAKMPYKWVFLCFTLIGARLDLVAVWSFADIANGLMAVPNLIALIALSGTIVVITKKYLREKTEGLHRPYNQTYIH